MSVTDDVLQYHTPPHTHQPYQQQAQQPYQSPQQQPQPQQPYQHPPAQQPYQAPTQQQSYPSNNSQGGFAAMLKDDDPAYAMPMKLYVAIYIRKGTPPDIVDRMKGIASSLLSSKFSIRYLVTGDPAIDPIMVDFLVNIRTVGTEVDIVTPWKDFGSEFMPLSPRIKQPSYRAKRHTASVTRNWAEMKPAMRSFRSSETALIIGRGDVSPAVAVLTWSSDGSETVRSLTAETKYCKHTYALCESMAVPLLNMRGQDAIERLDRVLSKYQHYQE